MAINLIKKKIKFSDKGVIKEKYVAKVYFERVVDLDEVAMLVSRASSLTPGDVRGAVEELAFQVAVLVGEGHPVDLGALGRFYPSIEAQTVDTAEEVTPKSVKNVNIGYRAKEEMKTNVRERGLRLRGKEVYSASRNRRDMKIIEE